MSRVEKLDNEEIFAEIKTGLSTTSGLAQYEKQKLSSLYNQFRALDMFSLTPADKTQLGWVAANWMAILDYVNKTYVPPKFAPSTLRGYIEAIANTLLAVDKSKYKNVVRPLFNTGLSMQQIIDKGREESTMTEQEMKNFVPFEDLVKERERLYAEWMKQPNNLKLHMFELILAFNTLVPPLRLNLPGMQIFPPRTVDGVARKVTEFKEPPENNTNYVYEYEAGKWAYCINQDKIQNKRDKSGKGRQIMKFEDEIKDVTNGKLLNSIINKSLDVMPRNHLLIGIKTKLPMIVTSYDSALGEMFKPKKPRQNLIRKSYVNFWYRKELSFGVLKEIADHMRHSVAVGLGSYKKIGIAAPTLISEEKKEPAIVAASAVVIPILPVEAKVIPIILEPEVKQAPIAPARVYFNPREYSRQYREAHRDEVNRRQQRNYDENKLKVLAVQIVRKLNHAQTIRPTAKSIEVYQLYQDSVSGKWKSRIE